VSTALTFLFWVYLLLFRSFVFIFSANVGFLTIQYQPSVIMAHHYQNYDVSRGLITSLLLYIYCSHIEYCTPNWTRRDTDNSMKILGWLVHTFTVYLSASLDRSAINLTVVWVNGRGSQGYARCALRRERSDAGCRQDRRIKLNTQRTIVGS